MAKQVSLQKKRFEHLKVYWEKELLEYQKELLEAPSAENHVMVVALSKLNTDFVELFLKHYIARCKIKYALAFF
jgi:hypothetical protein